MTEHKERRDATENRKLILKEAGALFEKFGVDAVSMHQIAKSAGIGQGTLYRRYSHKGELCMDMELTALQDKPFRCKFEAFFRLAIDFIDQKLA